MQHVNRHDTYLSSYLKEVVPGTKIPYRLYPEMQGYKTSKLLLVIQKWIWVNVCSKLCYALRVFLCCSTSLCQAVPGGRGIDFNRQRLTAFQVFVEGRIYRGDMKGYKFI